jgi:hypothetical protein
MKKIFTIVLCLMIASLKSQVIYSNSFGNLSLQNDIQVYGSNTITTTYTSAPAGFDLINDGLKNNIGSYNAPNKPFNVASLKTTGWAVGYNSIEADTFLVSTSWLDTSTYVRRYIISPVISSVTATSVLSWEAMAPDANYPDGYEVYVTTNTSGTLTANDFTPSNRVFYLADGNTPGQGEKNTWTKHGISLAAYAGMNIRVAFKNISQNMYQLWIDDVVVEDRPYSLDAELTQGNGFYKYNVPNGFGPVICRITNRGYTDISKLTLNYSITGITNISETFILSQPMTPYAVGDFTFTTAYNITTPGYYKVKIWVNSTNLTADNNHNNDTINTYLCIVTSAPAKNTLVEQFLSTNDGFSPDGQEKLKALASSSLITINYHDSDSLTVLSASGLVSTYRKKTTTAMVDRTYFSDLNSVPVERTAYSTRINQRKSVVVPVSVSITGKTYDSLTRVLNFTVSAAFTGEVKGDYRFNAVLTENNIYGPYNDTTFNGWNQLSFMYNIPFSPYFQMGYYYAPLDGYVLNGGQYVHQNVAEAMLDSSFGVAGIIPTTGGTQGQTYTRAYSYTLPATPAGQFRYTADNMYIVAYVAEHNINKNFRTVLNCTQTKLTSKSESMVGIRESSPAANIVLYPNPAYNSTNIFIPENTFKNNVLINIIDITGREVYQEDSHARFGIMNVDISHLQNGTYFVLLNDGQRKLVKKLVIAK